MSSVRTVVVVRHAEAEPQAASDAERPLTPGGVGTAEGLGRWLVEAGVRPDVALVSDALRTRQTWEAIGRGSGWTLAPDVDGGLYAAGLDSALDLLRGVDDDVATVVLLGHNPTVHSLIATLDDGEGDADAILALAGGCPPATAVVFEVAGSWADLGPGSATVRAAHRPA